MSDQKIELKREYFNTLRDEIKATKARIFIILVLGLMGAPLLTYVTVNSPYRALHLVAPILVLLLLVLYLSEQTIMMRAGSYIRQKIESSDEDWEHWVGSLKLRAAEQQLFAMFIVVGLFLYTVLSFIVVSELLDMKPYDEGLTEFSYRFWKYGGLGFYALATLWALGTMMRFWRAATGTFDH